MCEPRPARGCTGYEIAVHAACKCGRDWRLSGRARAAAHEKHAFHVRDAGGVPAQGLVELDRVLPRVASRAHSVRRATGREVRVAANERGVHAARVPGRGMRLQIGGGRKARGEQRTRNISNMFVTREVSQLRGWLKASACCRGSQAGHTVRGGLRAGRREAASDRGAHAACRGERACNCRLGGRGAGCSAPETCRSCS